MTTHTPESVLTPDFAKSVVRVVASGIVSALLEDLAQEALLRGVKAFRRSHVEHPRAFFTKIVRDTLRDHWRRDHILLVPLEDMDPRKVNHVPNPEARLDHSRQTEQMREALQLLSPQERELMELFYLEELPLAELSEILGKSRSALKMRLLRARRKIIRAVRTNSVRRDASRKNSKKF